MRIVKPSVTVEWATPDAALAIERAARTCYRGAQGGHLSAGCRAEPELMYRMADTICITLAEVVEWSKSERVEPW